MPDDNGKTGLAANLKIWIGVGAAVATLITGWIAVDNGWFAREKARECNMSGTVFEAFSGNPAAGIQIGFRPENGSTDFVLLTRSTADGTFSTSCEVARSRTSGSEFELLVKGRFQGGPLPCLGPPERTLVYVDRVDESPDRSIQVRGC